MWLLTMPGVYPAQADTWLLARALRDAGIPRGARVLDIGPGSGTLSIAAGRAGAAEVLAVDLSWPATIATWCNARLRRLPITVRRGDALNVAAGKRFDVIVANPPYVPARRTVGRGRARAWDAGLDGRAMLDRLTALAPHLLTPGGVLLIVHSVLCNVDKTLAQLRAGGLTAAVVAKHVEPFGPVLRGRAEFLAERGLIEPGQRHEELVVIRGERTEHAAAA